MKVSEVSNVTKAKHSFETYATFVHLCYLVMV